MAALQLSSVSFNGKKIEQELDGIVQRQLPFLAAATVNRLRYQAQLDLQASMRNTFTSLVDYTLKGVMVRPRDAENSPLYKRATKDRLYAYVLINFDGQNPRDEYLLPQIIGGPVYRTAFQRRLKNTVSANIDYMLPLHKSGAAKLTKDGRIRPSQYTEALYGIGAMEEFRAPAKHQTKLSKLTGKNTRYRTDLTYVYVPYNAIRPGQANNIYFKPGSRGKPLAPGIYKAKWGKGNTPTEMTQLFAHVRRIPTVRPKWNFVNVVETSVAANADKIFKEVVDKYAYS